MIFPLFLTVLVQYGLILTGEVIIFRAVSNLLNPPLKLTPVLKTNNGAIQGKIGYSRNLSEYWQFLGIPYAEPPVHSLRFQPPVPAKRWNKMKRFIEYPPACVQFDQVIMMKASGQEDCLYLNVFVNRATEDSKKPVLIYIHGGGYFSGESGGYHPEYFMDHPIVLVTLNYRLGPFGFLNFQENDTQYRYPRGNMGLKDQNLAFQWVQRNIDAFGGDPDRITIVGQSAGATAVHYHILSPLSQGLFQRAVAISGSALCPWAYTGNPRSVAINYAKRVGCPTDNMAKLFECFLRFDANELVQYQSAWGHPLVEKDLFLPSVEVGAIWGEENFLPASPEELMKSYRKRRESHVPLLAGVASSEGGIRAARFEAMPELIPKLDKNWNALIGRVLLQDDAIMKPRIAEELRRLYFDNSSRITEDVKGFIKNLSKLTSDVLFYEPIHNAVIEHSRLAPTYMYYYDYKSAMLPGSCSFYRSVRPRDRGISERKLLQGLLRDWTREHFLGDEEVHESICHGEELFQLFNINGFSKWFSDEDMKFSRSFVKAIVDFSTETKPVSFRGAPWPPVSSGLLRQAPNMLLPYLVMDNTGTGRLTEEPFYPNRVEKLNQLFARH